jgi:hypothetical protein
MMNKKMLFVGTVLSAVLCFLSGTAVGQRCEKLNMLEKSCEDLAECNGYAMCEICRFVGNPNASVEQYMDYELLDNAIVLYVDVTYTTKHGEMWAENVAVMHFGAYELGNGFGASGYIYGGTGKYEGVTGWITGASVPEDGTMMTFQGEICWPDD